MADIFEIVGKVSLDGIDKAEKDLKGFSNEGEQSASKLSKLGGIAGAVGKGVLIGTGAVATGAVALVKSVSGAYGQLQQSIGGVETLFGESAQRVIDNANNAYTTAGISANDYMQQVTSFSASLLQSLGGDTEKACNYADTAVRDMADNANKMGTSMEDIQHAYQGFAKGNYTMLDNLKLGYGGTATEMARLINDSGVLGDKMIDLSDKQNIGNALAEVGYAKQIEAIHKIQEEMGITGTTALEAGGTIEGSFNSLSASWENFVAGLGNSDADMKVLVENLAKGISGAINNVIPVINNMVAVLPTVMDSLIGAVSSMLPTMINTFTELITQVINAIAQLLPQFVPLAVDCIMTVVNALFDNLPILIQAGGQLVVSLAQAIFDNLPKLISKGAEMMTSLGSGLAENLPVLIDKGLQAIQSFATTLAENAPTIIQAGMQLLVNLVQGIMNSLPIMIERIPTIISTFANIINDNAPTILIAGVNIILTIIKGLISAIPTLVANIPKIIQAILDVWEAFNWINLGKNVIKALGDGITSMIGFAKNAISNVKNRITSIISKLPSNLMQIGKNGISGLANAISGSGGRVASAGRTIFNVIVSAVRNLPSKMLSIGSNIVRGIWSGISGAGGWLMNQVSGFASRIVRKIKNSFGIKSPSRVMRDEIGVFITQGIGVGIEEDDSAEKSIRNKVDSIIGVANSSMSDVRIGSSVSGLVGDNPVHKYQIGFDAQFSTLNDGFERLLSLVGQYLPDISSNINRPIVLDGNAVAVGISRKIDTQLGKMSVAKGRGNV